MLARPPGRGFPLTRNGAARAARTGRGIGSDRPPYASWTASRFPICDGIFPGTWRARRGQRIKVTSRGRVVAELVPATAGDDAPEDVRRRLRGSVLRFADPLAPVLPESDWTLFR